ncbi:MAG: hypothetical protein J0L96_02460 [Anaerolineae bacterium]|nr:hypothetical protein [Anaerolineae bacterium]
MSTEYRKHAVSIIEYFDESVQDCIEHPDCNIGVWKKGLDTAHEWLRLIDSEKVTRDELLSFIGVVHANRYNTVMWFDLAERAYDWVSSKEVISLPPRDIFLKSDGLGLGHKKLDEISKTSSTEHAQTLFTHFSLYTNEDPNSEVWIDGLNIVKEWQKLLNSQHNTDTEISSLLRNLDDSFRKYLGISLWLDLVIAVGYWCKSIGRIGLVPKRFQLLVG